jgi:hypothetical protein
MLSPVKTTMTRQTCDNRSTPTEIPDRVRNPRWIPAILSVVLQWLLGRWRSGIARQGPSIISITTIKISRWNVQEACAILKP